MTIVAGAGVRVLAGEYKGRKAKVVSVDIERATAEVVVAVTPKRTVTLQLNEITRLPPQSRPPD
jgi:transcription antitermination factor NusG